MHFPTVLVPKRVGIPANIGPTPGNVTMANNFASMKISIRPPVYPLPAKNEKWPNFTGHLQ